MFWNKFVLSGYVQEGVLNNNFQAHILRMSSLR